MNEVDEIAAHVMTQIPRQAVEDLDNTCHPGHVMKGWIERAALDNAFLNGNIAAITSFRDLLGDALANYFPKLTHLRQRPSSAQNSGNTIEDHGTKIKKEEL